MILTSCRVRKCQYVLQDMNDYQTDLKKGFEVKIVQVHGRRKRCSDRYVQLPEIQRLPGVWLGWESASPHHCPGDHKALTPAAAVYYTDQLASQDISPNSKKQRQRKRSSWMRRRPPHWPPPPQSVYSTNIAHCLNRNSKTVSTRRSTEPHGLKKACEQCQRQYIVVKHR